jgi:hypothetical protein
MITIDKNIPIPELRGRKRLLPLGEMEVGDSFFTTATSHASIRTAPHLPKRFTIRTVTENGVKGLRVWRIA